MQQKRIDRITNVVAQRQSGIVLVLEDIHDPHNAAAILRSADAFGIQKIYFVFDQEKKYNPKRVGTGASSSANKWLNFTLFDSISACIAALKKEGYTIIATALTNKSESLARSIFSEKQIAVLAGNEHRGLSPEALALSDRTVMIPMTGFVQSLNVSVATAIVLWEITKQRQGEYHLSAKEQKQLRNDFMKRAKK